MFPKSCESYYGSINTVSLRHSVLVSSLHFHAPARPGGFGFSSLDLVLEFLGLEQLGGLCEGSVVVTGTPEPSVRTPH